MSGRLVILPHKSWNVWGRENKEKVARDERNAREEEELKQLEERISFQQQSLEILRRNAEDVDDCIELVQKRAIEKVGKVEEETIAGIGTGQHINLFEEEEKRQTIKRDEKTGALRAIHHASEENEDYKMEEEVWVRSQNHGHKKLKFHM